MSEGQRNSLAANASLGAGDSLWQACIDQLAQELPEQQFNTWIKPLVAQVSDDFSQGHAVRGQPLQARLGPGPVRRPDRRHAGEALWPAGAPGVSACSS